MEHILWKIELSICAYVFFYLLLDKDNSNCLHFIVFGLNFLLAYIVRVLGNTLTVCAYSYSKEEII